MNPDRDHVDHAIDALLRAHSAETPPAELDAAILAAAHRAVQSAPREAKNNVEATRPWRWWMPLAAAATIGAITIGVLQIAPKQPDATSTIVSDTPSIVAVPARPVPPPAAPAERDKAEAPRTKVRSDRAAQAPAARAEAERAPAPEPFPAASDKPMRESSGNAVGTVQRSAAAPAAPAATAKSALADASARSAAEWIERIRVLVTEDKLADAAQELTAFRAAYVDADARLPAELQAWAATVKR